MERVVRETERRAFTDHGNKSGESSQVLYLSDDGEVLIGFKEPTLTETYGYVPPTLVVRVSDGDH